MKIVHLLILLILIFSLSVPAFTQDGLTEAPVKEGSEVKEKGFIAKWNIVLVLIAWVFSFLIGLVIVLVWRHGMNTARAQTHAASYVVPDSLVFKQKKDRFLYSMVNKVKRQTSTASRK